MSKFDKIEEAIADIKAGRMIIVVDDEDRENEGDFIMAAEMVTPEAINFMSIYGKGLICTPITSARAKELELDLMVKSNDALHQTAFTVSIDSIYGGTGISAQDRALTIKEMVRKDTRPDEFMRPGHIFPLIAKDGGVVERPGHTEASVDLARLAGLYPAGVICEIIDDDGSMARRDRLFEIAKQHNLKMITIEELIKYRNQLTSSLIKTSEIDFPNKYGHFTLHMFEKGSEHHFALVKGDLSSHTAPIVRLHSECLTGDVFGSLRCDCGDQLSRSMELIEKEGSGILIYLRQEGRGIGLPNKIRAYTLQDQGIDTVDANLKLGFRSDLREYGSAAEILKLLNVKTIRLMTNNPDKINSLQSLKIEVVERIPVEIEAQEKNHRYLMTKKEKMGHLLIDVEVVECSLH
jgi:3,4-dihydroxy 2-butanone 4-phosphate synthase / GTP cyclohydrolase II